MITITNIRFVRKGQYDETLAIVRSYKSKSDWIFQKEILSPSWDLFKKYRRMAEQGIWGKDTFQNIYVPQFLQEMHSNAAKKELNRLYLSDKAGKNIALTCFCPDESLCHRSIIAGLLQGAGCQVQTETGRDYSAYYRQYLAVANK